MRIGRRLQALVDGLVNYGNPLQIVLRRWLASRTDIMTITDRRTGVSVAASVGSYQMFGETWYKRDYDVPGCPLRPGDVVIDIGANQGFYTCYAATRGATVYAYEPYPPSFQRLIANVERNGLTKQIHASQRAVAATSGSVTLRCFDDLGGGMNSTTGSHLPDVTPDGVMQVEAVDPGTVLRAIGRRVRVCKLDCEGAELDIVRAIEDPGQIDAFAMEFHPDAYAVSELVEAVRRWSTHQIAFSPQSYVLYAVADAVLLDYARGGFAAVHSR